MLDVLSQLQSINIFKDILVPSVAALFAVWFATRKFQRERLWQDKYIAYQNVIGAVEEIRYWGDEISSDAHMLPSIGDFGGKTPYEFYAAAQRGLIKQAAVGSLLLSSRFVAALEELNTRLFRERFTEAEESYQDPSDAHLGYGEHAARIRAIADEHLPRLISLARSDLK